MIVCAVSGPLLVHLCRAESASIGGKRSLGSSNILLFCFHYRKTALFKSFISLINSICQIVILPRQSISFTNTAHRKYTGIFSQYPIHGFVLKTHTLHTYFSNGQSATSSTWPQRHHRHGRNGLLPRVAASMSLQ